MREEQDTIFGSVRWIEETASGRGGAARSTSSAGDSTTKQEAMGSDVDPGVGAPRGTDAWGKQRPRGERPFLYSVAEREDFVSLTRE